MDGGAVGGAHARRRHCRVKRRRRAHSVRLPHPFVGDKLRASGGDGRVESPPAAEGQEAAQVASRRWRNDVPEVVGQVGRDGRWRSACRPADGGSTSNGCRRGSRRHYRHGHPRDTILNDRRRRRGWREGLHRQLRWPRERRQLMGEHHYLPIGRRVWCRRGMRLPRCGYLGGPPRHRNRGRGSRWHGGRARTRRTTLANDREVARNLLTGLDLGGRHNQWSWSAGGEASLVTHRWRSQTRPHCRCGWPGRRKRSCRSGFWRRHRHHIPGRRCAIVAIHGRALALADWARLNDQPRPPVGAQVVGHGGAPLESLAASYHRAAIGGLPRVAPQVGGQVVPSCKRLGTPLVGARIHVVQLDECTRWGRWWRRRRGRRRRSGHLVHLDDNDAGGDRRCRRRGWQCRRDARVRGGPMTVVRTRDGSAGGGGERRGGALWRADWRRGRARGNRQGDGVDAGIGRVGVRGSGGGRGRREHRASPSGRGRVEGPRPRADRLPDSGDGRPPNGLRVLGGDDHGVDPRERLGTRGGAKVTH